MVIVSTLHIDLTRAIKDRIYFGPHFERMALYGEEGIAAGGQCEAVGYFVS